MISNIFSEENQKKIITVFLIFALIVGTFFLIFAIFINRGKLIIQAQAPYKVNVDDFKTLNCDQNTCEIVLAPKEYKISVEKEGYETFNKQVKVSLGKETTEKITFDFIPTITLKGSWNPVRLPEKAQQFGQKLLDINLANTLSSEPESLKMSDSLDNIKDLIFSPDGKSAFLNDSKNFYFIDLKKPSSSDAFKGVVGTENFSKIDINPQSQIFYDPTGESIAFIDLDGKNFKQTLYQIKLFTDESKISLTTFIRSIKKYYLIFSPDLTKIALVDQTDAENSVYIIDLTEKTRTKILTKASITGLKWFIDISGDFLIETKNLENNLAELWHWDSQQNTLKPIALSVDLNNLIPQNKNTLLAAISNNSNSAAQIAASNQRIQADSFSFIEYNLATDQTKVLKEVNDLSYPLKIEFQKIPQKVAVKTPVKNSINKDKSSETTSKNFEVNGPSSEILFLSDNKIYSLRYAN